MTITNRRQAGTSEPLVGLVVLILCGTAAYGEFLATDGRDGGSAQEATVLLGAQPAPDGQSPAVPPTRPTAPLHPAKSLFTFDHSSQVVDSPPPGWKAEGTNQKGPVATWKVVKDAAAPSAPNVLSLTSVNHDSGDTFNICWTENVRFTDGAVEVRFRADAGKEDQGGGLIWRVKDNYMVARMNPLEDNFRVYYVKDGARKQLATATVKVAAGTWHTMKIEQAGALVRCFIDGTKHLEATDTHIHGEGGVGVWTKADAASSFDDLGCAHSLGQ